ncbi:MAG: hypothetical protein M3539_18750 [Acidobacteriota bacterium]|nr:hypothetical protein [Acidobacteriota bacterium]
MKLQTLLLFVLLIGAGTSNITAQEECKRHIEPQGGFSICLPAGWSVEERQGQKHKQLFAPRDPRFTANINFRDEANTMPLEEYVAAGIKHILASAEKVGATSIKFVSQEPFVTDAGMSGVRVTFRSEYKGYLIRTRQYLFNGRPGEKLVVTGTELEADQAIHDPVFDRAVKSFRLET